MCVGKQLQNSISDTVVLVIRRLDFICSGVCFLLCASEIERTCLRIARRHVEHDLEAIVCSLT